MSINPLVRALAITYLATMMFSIGLLLGGRPKPERQVRRHERHLLIRALVIDLVVLPVVAWSILRLVGAHGRAATALLLLAAAPGSRILPLLARRAQGELGLSVEISLWLAKLTAFTAPVTLALLIDIGRVHVHDLRIILALVCIQLLPYLAGRSVRHHWSSLATRLTKPLDIACAVLVVAVLALVVAGGKLEGLVLIGATGWLAVLSFSALSLTIGWFSGGRSGSVRRSFALAVNSRDLSLSLTLGLLAFPARHVELPLFGAWLITFACNVGFAEVVGRRAHSTGGEVFA
jgi:bile acid:Na+ symporter, BASS family